MLSVSDLKSFIRSGGFAWPGGYPCMLLMSDCECIDARSARENDYNKGGVLRERGRDYSIGVQLHRMQYRSAGMNMTPNAWAIYRAAESRLGLAS